MFLKEAAYKILDIATLGRGIKKDFQGNKLRIPTRYFRYFPRGYEKENFDFINTQVKPGMTVVDMGAHIGLMSVTFGKRAGKDGKILAIEPTPSTLSVLRKTIDLNKLGNIKVIPCAVADQEGTMI